MTSRGIPARNKGKAYERLISELFTELSKERYRRTPLSGGLRMEFPGDIMKTSRGKSIFDGLLVEIKNQKILKIPQWIKESQEELEDADYMADWILIFRSNAKNYFVINEKLFRKWVKKMINEERNK